MSDRLHLAISTRLREGGQRYTAGRRRLVDALLAAGRPLTAAEVLADGGLAQSSAYRNLAVLDGCGVVHKVAGTDDLARFEVAEDLTEHHHHHLICTACGRVTDFTVSDDLERALEAATETVGRSSGFVPERHRLDLLGRCAACA